MKRLFSVMVLCSILCPLAADANPVYLNANTPVQVSASRSFNTDSVGEGQRVKFETVAPTRHRGNTFIYANAPVEATVVMNKNNGLNGEGARMILDKFTVETASGEEIRLRCKQDFRGDRRRVPNITAGGGARVGGPFGVFMSVPILSLFVKGRDVRVNAGEEFTCYTLSEFELIL